MRVNVPAALCAAFLISLSASAMNNSSLSLYDGSLQFECLQDAQRVKLTAKTTKQFAAKIKANSASGNQLSYSFSGGSTMSMGFGVDDLPIQFNVMSDSQEPESFTLDVECQIKRQP